MQSQLFSHVFFPKEADVVSWSKRCHSAATTLLLACFDAFIHDICSLFLTMFKCWNMFSHVHVILPRVNRERYSIILRVGCHSVHLSSHKPDVGRVTKVFLGLCEDSAQHCFSV